MGTRICIMDMELDLLTPETLQEELSAYLSEDNLNVIHMISLDYLDAYDENELVRQVLEQADLVLPGEKTVLSAHHVEMLESGGMVVDYHALLEAICPLNLENQTYYFVLRNKKEAKALYRYVTKPFSKENVLGLYTADSDVSEEALINDINTKLPDIIFLSMDSTEQEEWLENNKGKLNAKLCFVMGSVMPLIMRDNVHVPLWIKKIGLAGIYRRAAKIPYSHFFRKRIFNRKMDDYITKKNLQR
ncbi:MAG: WecB/TagA/CpsF family glycosyltransferase [Lachnospiraceae bacterium]|nr:WecB/TagA/CpsF family glycosyltransferase [Lachnospiraceae bacterium]